MTERARAGSGSGRDWYKDAIIYELRTRSFFDGNDDGIGDFRGLTSKLDYLADLGVTAIWLLPFYPSPGRDDGYDISDYTDVHPDVGTLADFEALVAEAHRRGMKIITELVLNHTSDQHPWFARARRAPKGSPERDFYVWSDTADRYRDARIIFKDFEPSNWSWDPVANAHYWHRFYTHQPDLNFENPAVQEALLGAVDFWLEKGVDGLRLDAVPYLYEEDGTSCENLPQTHAFLKKLRAHIDAKFEDRMLLAEANQWPEDAAAYFGDGDECHMNFHFPLMPRIFLSIHTEDRFPITDIFAQTPKIPESCQWALFLRNHDELTLEMVTDEERDYMYRAYADQAAMRINLGIRRRLAPLVGNSRRKIELLNGLLFSLPGTPVLYYGDEIGMGDNVYLGDRNGVRTPMQWSMDRNAGFSRANPQRLILPIIIDPEYHYESLNVENQQSNPTSLLWWTKRLVALRKRYAAFGRGTTEYLPAKNSRVLSFVRAHGRERILVVANLSRFVQYVELDLRRYAGATPVEMFGKSAFPVIGEAPYVLTLGPHAFYWFSLEMPRAAGERPSLPPGPTALVCSSVEALLLGPERPLLEAALPAIFEDRPWSPRFLQRLSIVEVVRKGAEASPVYFVLVRAEVAEAQPETYLLPLVFVPGEEGAGIPVQTRDGPRGVLVDATEHPAGQAALLACVATDAPLAREPARVVSAQIDGTTLAYGERHVLHVFRRVDDGPSPELEMGRFLARVPAVHALVAPLEGAIEVHRPRGAPVTLGVLHGQVPHADSAWHAACDELQRYYERVLALPSSDPPPPPPARSRMSLAGQAPPPVVAETIGSFRDLAAKLGANVADLHLALASDTMDPTFAPEPYTPHDRRSKYQSLRNLAGRVLRLLDERQATLPPLAQREAAQLLSRQDDVMAALEPLLRTKITALRIRVHGNLHLGRVLFTGKDFVVVGWNGFRELTYPERRRKRSPLRDLAWMARSFDFAAMKVLLDPARVREADVERARPWGDAWATWVSAAFLDGYLARAGAAPFVPDREQATIMFDAFLLERTFYQLHGHLEAVDGTPTIPLLGIASILPARTS